MKEITEHNWYSIGLLYLNINEIIDMKIPENTFLRIILDPYILETKTIKSPVE